MFSRTKLSSFSLALVTPTVFTAVTAAQIPAGHVVIAEIANWTAGCCSTPGGVRVVHPRIGGIQDIANLPPELIGSVRQPASLGSGSSAVVVRPTDGALLVGERVYAGESVDLHVLRLQGLTVVSDTVVPLFTASTDGDRVTGVAVLPSGDAVVAASIGSSGAIARVSTRGTVSLIHAPVTVGFVAVDTGGTTAFFVTPAGIESIPIAGGQPVLIHAATSISHLQFVPPASLMFPRQGTAWLLDLTTRIATALHTDTCVGCLARAVLERVTGALVYTQLPIGIFPGTIGWANPGGTFALLGSTNFAVDIAIVDNPRTYGTRSPAAHAYTWQTTLNPGGLPRIGNLAFGVQIEVRPAGPATGLLAVALAPADLQLLGVRVLLDLATVTPLATVPANGRVALPIPAVQSLVGQSLFLQSYHVDAGGLAASDGLQITCMQ